MEKGKKMKNTYITFCACLPLWRVEDRSTILQPFWRTVELKAALSNGDGGGRKA